MRQVRRFGPRAFALVGAAIISCQSGVARETDVARKVDQPTARRLAAEAVHGRDEYLEFFEYDSGISTNFTPPFLAFDGITKPPAEGFFGVFAVNPWTGDVWNLWGCRRLSTPVLRRSQAAIRGRLTREELKQYDRLRRLKPECTVED